MMSHLQKTLLLVKKCEPNIGIASFDVKLRISNFAHKIFRIRQEIALFMLKVNEIYYSLQGESTAAGLPCVFVRLTYCNLRCTYCDTEYAFYDGKNFSIPDIISEVKKYDCNLVEITGGEPLVQMADCLELMKQLSDEGFEVLIETGGSLLINEIDQRVKIIMDLKCPLSGMEKKNLYENIDYLKPTDELKFVIGSREDFNWTKEIISKYSLEKKCEILFSVVFGKLEPVQLVSWILEDKLNVRFQLQMHKFIWHPETKGV
jgi:7-carboxy-7-deazaguanine synthase